MNDLPFTLIGVGIPCLASNWGRLKINNIKRIDLGCYRLYTYCALDSRGFLKL